MRVVCLTLLCLFVAACDSERSEQVDSVIPERPTAGIELKAIEENVSHDTLLIHETFELKDGTYLMSARHVDEKFEGLRLYHYALTSDGEQNILHYSAPAYDSWMMRPNLFEHPDGGYLIFAEIGSTDSWGQRIFHLTDTAFVDRGFIDAAIPEIRETEKVDSTYTGFVSVIPYVKPALNESPQTIRFEDISIHVFDDGQGNLDTLYAGNSIYYELAKGKFELKIEPTEP